LAYNFAREMQTAAARKFAARDFQLAVKRIFRFRFPDNSLSRRRTATANAGVVGLSEPVPVRHRLEDAQKRQPGPLAEHQLFRSYRVFFLLGFICPRCARTNAPVNISFWHAHFCISSCAYLADHYRSFGVRDSSIGYLCWRQLLAVVVMAIRGGYAGLTQLSTVLLFSYAFSSKGSRDCE